jgi:hypothetical protein
MTLDWSRAVVLSCTEFEVCWGVLGLGETPWQLDPPPSGIITAERQAIVSSALEELRRRGLGDGRGPGPVVTEQMRLLSHPERSIDIRFRADALVAGVAAVRGQRCTLAVRHAGEIALIAISPESAAHALLELLGPVTPGPGREVHLRADVLDGASTAAPRDHDRFVDELVWRGLPRAEARMLTDMCRDVHMRGQLGASASARDGTRMRRAPYVVGFHRTATGSFRQVRRRMPGGDVVAVGPTSRERMLADLGDLVGSIR